MAPPQLIVPEPAPLTDLIAQACARVPPLWPLKNFVAVNPFLGLTQHSFLQACFLLRRVQHHDTLIGPDFVRQALASGQMGEADVESASEQLQEVWPEADALWLGEQTFSSLRAAIEHNTATEGAVLSFADWLDETSKTNWSAFVTGEVAKWCAAYFDQGQSSWAMPWRGESLWQAWKGAASLDRNPEVAGIPGFRSFVQGLPADPEVWIAQALDTLGVPRAQASDFLHRQLCTISGWSAAVQYQVREAKMGGQEDASLMELLAIRLAYDLALFRAMGQVNVAPWHAHLESQNAPSPTPRDLLALAVFQRALEIAYQRTLIAQLASSSAGESASTRPCAQAVFCIDVRSEVFRRALEGASAHQVHTLGFAGFFGFAIEHVPLGHEHGSAQCPVLLSPAYSIRESAPDAAHLIAQKQEQTRFKGAWSDFKSSLASSFSFVETAGLGSFVPLVQRALRVAPPAKEAPVKLKPESGMTLDAQIQTALGALKGMSLTQGFGRLVLLCGHGSHTTNNPYGSGLDCGACGGHTGEANARIAASAFNNSQVREGLKAQGVIVPEDTHFLAGLHNTTTDEVTLFDLDEVPASHRDDVKQLQNWLALASQSARLERAQGLGLEGQSKEDVEREVLARALDWSQVRPEWGLAGNAAFIAAPRERTQHLQLGGRTFLHSYNADEDPEDAVLSVIMNAPMVVASWINLQYFGSTVANEKLGSGNKTIHNVVGKFAVVQGNGGDLQVGLPIQSLHDGQKWVHQPLRLSVFIETSPERMNGVIEQSEGVRELVDNDWLHLFAIEDEGKTISRYCGQGCWQKEA